MVKAYTGIPSHCNLVVKAEGLYFLVDAATVDCIDGILQLKLGYEQSSNNGLRYKMVHYPSDVGLTEEALLDLAPVDEGVLSQPLSTYFPFAVLKEDVVRDKNFDPVLPLQMNWVPRFFGRLPLLQPDVELSPSLIEQKPLFELVRFPTSLPYRAAATLLKYTVYGDPRAHHHKQWVGIRYTADSKLIVSGFRFIKTKRPYSERHVEWYGNDANQREHVGDPGDFLVDEGKVEENFERVRQRLEEEIGIVLSEEELGRLNKMHNYSVPNVDHVWAF